MSPLSADARNSIGMPPVGFGTYQLSKKVVEGSVAAALQAGYRHLDSAEGYRNEADTGRAIRSAGIDREVLFVTTKLFPGSKSREKTYQKTLDTLRRQLTDLQLDYVDLYLIHAPLASRRLEQWEALVELQHLGLTRHIGVSNYDETRLEEIRAASLPTPAVNQIELHPLNTQPQLSTYMAARSIIPVAYSSLAPLADWRAAKGQGGHLLADQKRAARGVIHDIAKALNVTPAKLLLRYGLQRGYCVLTRSTKPVRIKANIELFDFVIPTEQMSRLDALNQDQPFAWAASGRDPMKAAPALV